MMKLYDEWGFQLINGRLNTEVVKWRNPIGQFIREILHAVKDICCDCGQLSGRPGLDQFLFQGWTDFGFR